MRASKFTRQGEHLQQRQVQACPYTCSRSPRQDNSHVDTQSTPSVTSREVNPNPHPSALLFFNAGLNVVIFSAQVSRKPNLYETPPSGRSGVSFFRFFSGSPEHNRESARGDYEIYIDSHWRAVANFKQICNRHLYTIGLFESKIECEKGYDAPV